MTIGHEHIDFETPTPEQIKATRKRLGHTSLSAGRQVGVSGLTWQRWEGQTERKTEIPFAAWTLFLLLNDIHPILRKPARRRTPLGERL